MVKDLVQYIVKELVSFPDDVQVTVTTVGDKDTLEIKVNDQDRGRLIGKEGKTIKAIRGLVNVVLPEGKKIMVEIAQ